ncbi:MAG: tetratricopeptide repeat protein, partial [Sediminibacterium sp.]|nr:tetratricopeptide repeat protein [Sediminibacterium sp.]
DALDSLGAPKQALGQMDSLLVRDSLNYGLWYRKALLQEHAADTAGALKSYQYAIRVYPAPDALLGAANLLAEQKDSRSLLLCRQVEQLRLGREYTAHCSFISGVYYARTGDRTKAIESFNTCINNDMNYTEAYMEKGFLFYENKQFKEATQVFLTLTRVRNTYADGYYWLAKCYEAQANSTDAIANYRTALTLDPKLLEASAALQRLGVK